MAAGMGAGVAAIFRAPLAGALFAAEVLYRSPEFEPEVIIPAGLASVVAYCTFGLFFGWRPLFEPPRPLTFSGPDRTRVGYCRPGSSCAWSCWRCSTRAPSTG